MIFLISSLALLRVSARIDLDMMVFIFHYQITIRYLLWSNHPGKRLRSIGSTKGAKSKNQNQPTTISNGFRTCLSKMLFYVFIYCVGMVSQLVWLGCTAQSCLLCCGLLYVVRTRVVVVGMNTKLKSLCSSLCFYGFYFVLIFFE